MADIKTSSLNFRKISFSKIKNPKKYLTFFTVTTLLIIVFASAYFFSQDTNKDIMSSDFNEVGEEVVRVLGMNPSAPHLEFSLDEVQHMGNGVLLINIILSSESESELMTVFSTEDGELFFPEAFETQSEDVGALNIEQAEEINKDMFKEVFSEQGVLNNSTEVETGETTKKDSGVFETEIVAKSEDTTDRLIVFLSEDGQLFFPEGNEISLMEEEFRSFKELEEVVSEDNETNRDNLTSNFSEEDIEGLTDCLSEENIVLYGNDHCPFTHTQLEVFGNYQSNINYFECLGNESYCKDEGVEKIPSWKVNDKVYEGVKSLEQLSNITSCSVTS